MSGRIYQRNIGAIAVVAILSVASLGTAARAQGPQGFGGRFGNMGPDGGIGRGGGMRGFGRGQREVTVVTIPVAVLAKQLNLSADQTAQITAIQNGLQTKRQQMMDEVRAAFPRPDQNNGGNGGNNGADGNGNRAFTRPDPATMQAIQTRFQAAEQAIQTDEQAKIKAIRALLTQDQLSALKTLESDVTEFTTLGIPVETLADFFLSNDERTAVTAVYQDARRQLQQAEQKMQAQMQAQNPAGQGGQGWQQGGRSFGGGGRGGQDFSEFRSQMDQLRQEINQKALAALSPANRASVEAYVKAHPTPQFGGRQFGGQRPGNGA